RRSASFHPTKALLTGQPSSLTQTTSSSTLRLTALTSVVTQLKHYGCWMRCRPTSFAPATGRRAKKCLSRPRKRPSYGTCCHRDASSRDGGGISPSLCPPPHHSRE